MLAIEQPYQGRATWLDAGAGAEIHIPDRRNWLIIGFLMVWLFAWLVGEAVALGIFTGVFFGTRGHPVSLFVLAWLVSWTLSSLFVIRTLWGLLTGREQLTIGGGTRTLAKPGLLHRAKTYDLAEMHHVRVQEDPQVPTRYGRRNLLASDRGFIPFDYGLKTMKFGAGLAEARFLVERLRQKQLLTERSFA